MERYFTNAQEYCDIEIEELVEAMVQRKETIQKVPLKYLRRHIGPAVKFLEID